MIQTFRFVQTAAAPATLYLTQTALAALGMPHLSRTVVGHGCRRLHAAVVPLAEEGAELPVAPATAEALGLVEGIPYQLRWVDGEVRIGPVIGILAARRTRDIDPGPGSLARCFLLRYPLVGGLVYLCGAEDIDPATGTVAGYGWVPGESDEPDVPPAAEWERADALATRVRSRAASEEPPGPPHPRTARFQAMARAFLDQAVLPDAGPGWPGPHRLGEGRLVEGRFPLPSALWRRAGFLSLSTHEHLLDRMGNRIFNSSFFDKEEGYRMLCQHPRVGKYLPKTEPFARPDQMLPLLNGPGKAILKQTEGNSGYGLMRVERSEEGYVLRFRERNGAELFHTWADVAERLAPVAGSGKYLLQQAVELPAYQGRLNDYRVMMQKDDRGRWQATGIVGRFGQQGSIVTNFVNAGYALPPEESFQRAFGVGRREAYQMKTDLVRFATMVCEALDDSGGNYGDLGLDVGIDTERRPWLFEVNKLPFHELLLYAGDPQTYLAVKSGPLLYAAHLAGFGRRT